MSRNPNIKLRGIRAPIPSGYLVGNTSGKGQRQPQLIPVADIARNLFQGSGVVPATGGAAVLGPISDSRILANISGGSGAPAANSLSAILDHIVGSATGLLLYRSSGSGWIGLSNGSSNQVLKAGPAWSDLSALMDALFSSSQGAVLYRGSSAWAALGPGTAGQFLKTQGAAANPVWATGGGGLWAPVMSVLPTMAGTGFTTTNGTAGATYSDRTTGVSVGAPADTNGWRFLSQAAPATPYTRTALVALTGRAQDFYQAGIGWFDGTKFQLFAVEFNDTGGNRWATEIANFSNFTTYVSSPVGEEWLSSQPIWIQLVDDGTNISFRFSYSGDLNDFIDMYTIAKASGYLGATGYSNLIFGAQHFGASPTSKAIGTLMSWG